MPRVGPPRYVNSPPGRVAPMTVGGTDLGPPIKPQDILIKLRVIEDLSDPEIVECFMLALGQAEALAVIYPELTSAEIDAAIEAAAAVTPSRIKAWRTRNREMTWLELRMMLTGLRELVRGV